MPKLRPETEKARAISLIKLHSENKFNQTRVAELEGVSPSAICHRLNRAPVKKTLQEIINNNLKQAGISQRKVYKRLDEQLDATRTISAVISPDGKQKDANGQTCDFVEVPDNTARDKAIDKCLVLMGHLKHNGKGDNGDRYTFISGDQQVDARRMSVLVALVRERACESKPS